MGWGMHGCGEVPENSDLFTHHNLRDLFTHHNLHLEQYIPAIEQEITMRGYFRI